MEVRPDLDDGRGGPVGARSTETGPTGAGARARTEGEDGEEGPDRK